MRRYHRVLRVHVGYVTYLHAVTNVRRNEQQSVSHRILKMDILPWDGSLLHVHNLVIMGEGWRGWQHLVYCWWAYRQCHFFFKVWHRCLYVWLCCLHDCNTQTWKRGMVADYCTTQTWTRPYVHSALSRIVSTIERTIIIKDFFNLSCSHKCTLMYVMKFFIWKHIPTLFVIVCVLWCMNKVAPRHD